MRRYGGRFAISTQLHIIDADDFVVQQVKRDHDSEENHAKRGSEPPIQRTGDMIGDSVRNECAFRTANEFRSDVVTDGENEDEYGARTDPGNGVWKIDFPECEPRMRAERNGRANIAFFGIVFITLNSGKIMKGSRIWVIETMLPNWL